MAGNFISQMWPSDGYLGSGCPIETSVAAAITDVFRKKMELMFQINSWEFWKYLPKYTT